MRNIGRGNPEASFRPKPRNRPVLARVAGKKAMIRRTLCDLPQLILPNFSAPLLLADFLLACLDNSHGLHN